MSDTKYYMFKCPNCDSRGNISSDEIDDIQQLRKETEKLEKENNSLKNLLELIGVNTAGAEDLNIEQLRFHLDAVHLYTKSFIKTEEET